MIKFENVTYHNIFNNVSFTFNPGEKIGILDDRKEKLDTNLVALLTGRDRGHVGNVTISKPVDFRLEYITLHDEYTPIRRLFPAITEMEIWNIIDHFNLKSYIEPSLFSGVNLNCYFKPKISPEVFFLIDCAILFSRRNNVIIQDFFVESSKQYILKSVEPSQYFSNEFTQIYISRSPTSLLCCDRILIFKHKEIVEFDATHALLSDYNSIFWKRNHEELRGIPSKRLPLSYYYHNTNYAQKEYFESITEYIHLFYLDEIDCDRLDISVTEMIGLGNPDDEAYFCTQMLMCRFLATVVFRYQRYRTLA